MRQTARQQRGTSVGLIYTGKRGFLKALWKYTKEKDRQRWSEKKEEEPRRRKERRE